NASATANASGTQPAIVRPGFGVDSPYPGRSIPTSRKPASSACCPRYAGSNRLPGPPWHQSTGVPSGSPKVANPTDRPSKSSTTDPTASDTHHLPISRGIDFETLDPLAISRQSRQSVRVTVSPLSESVRVFTSEELAAMGLRPAVVDLCVAAHEMN